MEFKGFIKIDIKELQDYGKAWKAFQNNWDTFLEKYLLRLVGEIMRRAIYRTPRDTGKLAQSYKITKITRTGDLLQISIYNDASNSGPNESYASHVEMGHVTRNRKSFVEGVWMLTISVTEVEQEANRIFQEMFIKYAKEMGV